MLIISIVPRLKPAIDGVGDYALILARQLRCDFGIQTHFVVTEPTQFQMAEIDGFPVKQLTRHSATTLQSALPVADTAIVLLHYVGYGYATRGCPIWLVEGIHHWRAAKADRRLLTMFHEIYAAGRPPWTSAFWIAALQKHLAARLVHISDRLITSKQLYAEILGQLSKGKHSNITCSPIFSTIGEPQNRLPLAQRQRRLVIFGGKANRARVYRESLTQLQDICHRFALHEILDIGPPLQRDALREIGINLREMGELPATEVSEILSTSLAGFINYNPDYLAKSTIFAAYCSHGMLSISAQFSHFSIDGLDAGKHYLWTGELTDEIMQLSRLQVIANNAFAWYQSHNISVHTNLFASCLAE